MLMTSYGFIPWDDAHHPQLSQTDGVARRALALHQRQQHAAHRPPRPRRASRPRRSSRSRTAAGNHASPFITQNTRVRGGGAPASACRCRRRTCRSRATRRSSRARSPSSRSIRRPGQMAIAFQILMPGFDYDLSHAGKGPSHGWSFFTSYNTEQANTLLEMNASQNDKDFIAAVNWKKAEECVAAGKAEGDAGQVLRTTVMDERPASPRSEMLDSRPRCSTRPTCPGMVYFLPTPKSPHGVDVDPTGEYIVAGGKLATVIPVHSFTKMLKAIADKAFDGERRRHPGPQVRRGHRRRGAEPGPRAAAHRVRRQGLRLHLDVHLLRDREVEAQGLAKCVDRIPTYYSIGHLMIPGGDTRKPWGKYVIALNKITKDRYLPDRPGAGPGGAADRHHRRQDGAAARLPDHRRAALRAGAPGAPDQGQRRCKYLRPRGQQGPVRQPRARRTRRWHAQGQRRCTST